MSTAHCPNCGRPVDVASGPERPFCSARCRLIDLGAWLTDGARSIPGEGATADDGSSAAADPEDPEPGDR